MEQHVGGFFDIKFVGPVALKQAAFDYFCHFGRGLFQPIMSSGAAQLDESDSAASIRNRPKL